MRPDDGALKECSSIAMRGGLQHIVMLNFDFRESSIHTARHFCVGLLFGMISQHLLRQIVVEQMCIGGALLRAIFHPLSTPYLKVLAFGLIFQLTGGGAIL